MFQPGVRHSVRLYVQGFSYGLPGFDNQTSRSKKKLGFAIPSKIVDPGTQYIYSCIVLKVTHVTPTLMTLTLANFRENHGPLTPGNVSPGAP